MLHSRNMKEGIIEEEFLSNQEPLEERAAKKERKKERAASLEKLISIEFQHNPTKLDSTEVFNKVKEWTSQVLLTH